MQQPQAENVLLKMRELLKQRGASGIRGLARNFKICDSDGNRALDVDELRKCCSMCRLGLTEQEVESLHAYFDRDGNGAVIFDEFLRAVRGEMQPARKKLVLRVFNLLDERGDGNGSLSIADITNFYATNEHPEVKAGKRTSKDVLTEFLEGFEGDRGNHDGIVTLDEWTNHYENVSSSIDLDDYFGEMMVSTWRHLTETLSDGRQVPAVTYVPGKRVKDLEEMLKKAIYQKLKRPSLSESRALEETFKSIDLNKNGTVSFSEFQQAMGRYGLEASSDMSKQKGGLTQAELRALFDRYDVSNTGSLSYNEFAAGVFQEEKRPGTASTSTSLTFSGGSTEGIAPTNPSRPGTPGGAHTRVRSLANPGGARDPQAYTRSSGIFG